MATKKQDLNGSVDLLADAMRLVFTESMESVREVVKEDIEIVRRDMKEDIRKNIAVIRKDMNAMEDRLNKRNDITNSNMQAQFAQQEKKIASMLRK